MPSPGDLLEVTFLKSFVVILFSKYTFIWQTLFWKVLFILSFTQEKMTNLQLIPRFAHFLFFKTSRFS